MTNDGDEVGGQVPGELHRLADRHPVGHVVPPEQLVGADPEHISVHRRHAVQRPAFGIAGEQVVDPLPVRLYAADQLHGVLRQQYGTS